MALWQLSQCPSLISVHLTFLQGPRSILPGLTLVGADSFILTIKHDGTEAVLT